MGAGEHVQEEAAAAMEALGEQYPSLEGSYPRPKELIFSSLLSWQNLTGVYSPFTVEANYNGDITDYNIPLPSATSWPICGASCRKRRRILSPFWVV